MAVLEKIRSKSVFLLIIIGVALLAFILTDFLTSGRTLFGNGSTVAKVKGKKIDVMDLQDRIKERTDMLQAQANARGESTKYDVAQVRAQVLQEMIDEILLEEELDDLGLVVTEAEINAAIDKNASIGQWLDQRVISDRIPTPDGQQIIPSYAILADLYSNPAKYQIDENARNVYEQYLKNIRKDLGKELRKTKFYNMLGGALAVNKLEAKAYYDDNTTTSTIAYAAKDYASLPDKDYTVSDDEIKAEYDKMKERFALPEELRYVSFITVDIVPSKADRDAAMKKVQNLVKTLSSTDDLKGVDSDFETLTFSLPPSKITDPMLKVFLDSASAGKTGLIGVNGDTYTVAKLIGTRSAVDSVLVESAQIIGTRAQADSLIALLNAGTKLDSIIDNQKIFGSDSIWTSLLSDANNSPEIASLSEDFSSKAPGLFYTPDSIPQTAGDGTEYYRIFSVRERRPEVLTYDYLTATYTLEPSTATTNQLYGNLHDYVTKNSTAAAFKGNAAKAGYQAIDGSVTPSSPSISTSTGYLSYSYPAAYWAMKEGKKGQVSDVIEVEGSNRLIAVAVNDVYSDKYAPYTEPSVKEFITQKIIRDKKAKSLIDKYGKGKKLSEYADLMGTKVDTVTVTFSKPMIANLGYEGKIAAAVSAAKKGVTVSPVQGNNGVVAFIVTDVQTGGGRPYDYKEVAEQYQRNFTQALSQMLPRILLGREKVKNNSMDFFTEQ